MLTIHNLHVAIDGKQILNGVSLAVRPGETHVLMGPNGSGKSTLAYALMGHPDYKLQNKKMNMELDGEDLLKLSPDERAKKGLFLAFQNPFMIEGVSVFNLLKNVIKGDVVSLHQQMETWCKTLHLSTDFLRRSLNDGFSGGEKKKMELLQILMLKPKYAIIDEIDTGLDVDALKIVAEAIQELAHTGTGVIIITHYQRILQYVNADAVHVMIAGKIIKSAAAALAKEIEEKGYTMINSKSQIPNLK